jgi:hypothetical protein
MHETETDVRDDIVEALWDLGFTTVTRLTAGGNSFLLTGGDGVQVFMVTVREQ